jgi:hypothetical protein
VIPYRIPFTRSVSVRAFGTAAVQLGTLRGPFFKRTLGALLTTENFESLRGRSDLSSRLKIVKVKPVSRRFHVTSRASGADNFNAVD